MLAVLNDKLLEDALKGVEAVVNIIFVSVATYESREVRKGMRVIII